MSVDPASFPRSARVRTLCVGCDAPTRHEQLCATCERAITAACRWRKELNLCALLARAISNHKEP